MRAGDEIPRACQFLEVCRAPGFKTPSIVTDVQRKRRCVAIEPTEPSCESGNVVISKRAVPDRLIEHPILWQPVHLDEPVDCRSLASDRHPAVCSRDCGRPEIDARGETQIESHLFLAEVLT